MVLFSSFLHISTLALKLYLLLVIFSGCKILRVIIKGISTKDHGQFSIGDCIMHIAALDKLASSWPFIIFEFCNVIRTICTICIASSTNYIDGFFDCYCSMSPETIMRWIWNIATRDQRVAVWSAALKILPWSVSEWIIWKDCPWTIFENFSLQIVRIIVRTNRKRLIIICCESQRSFMWIICFSLGFEIRTVKTKKY